MLSKVSLMSILVTNFMKKSIPSQKKWIWHSILFYIRQLRLYFRKFDPKTPLRPRRRPDAWPPPIDETLPIAYKLKLNVGTKWYLIFALFRRSSGSNWRALGAVGGYRHCLCAGFCEMKTCWGRWLWGSLQAWRPRGSTFIRPVG